MYQVLLFLLISSYALLADEVSQTIEALYNKNSFEKKLDGIEVEIPKFVSYAHRVPIVIRTKIPTQSIAILQKREGYSSLMALIKPDSSQAIDYGLNVSFYRANLMSERVEVIVVLEDLEGRLYKLNSTIDFATAGCSPEAGECVKKIKNLDLNNLRVLFNTKFKKLKIGYSLTVINHQKEFYEEDFGFREGIMPYYITKLSMKQKGKLLTEVYLSEHVPTTFFLKFKSETFSKEDEVEVILEDLNGKEHRVQKSVELKG